MDRDTGTGPRLEEEGATNPTEIWEQQRNVQGIHNSLPSEVNTQRDKKEGKRISTDIP